MSLDKDESISVNLGGLEEAEDCRSKLVEEMILAKSKAQRARCEDLMGRLRTIELVQVQNHVEKQFKHLQQLVESNVKVPVDGVNVMPRQFHQTDYDNSLIDCIQNELQQDSSNNKIDSLINKKRINLARFLYHKRETKSIKAAAHVLGEIIGNALPDNTETESESEDESKEEHVLYKTVNKDQLSHYRPVSAN